MQVHITKNCFFTTEAVDERNFICKIEFDKQTAVIESNCVSHEAEPIFPSNFFHFLIFKNTEKN